MEDDETGELLSHQAVAAVCMPFRLLSWGYLCGSDFYDGDCAVFAPEITLKMVLLWPFNVALGILTIVWVSLLTRCCGYFGLCICYNSIEESISPENWEIDSWDKFVQRMRPPKELVVVVPFDAEVDAKPKVWQGMLNDIKATVTKVGALTEKSKKAEDRRLIQVEGDLKKVLEKLEMMDKKLMSTTGGAALVRVDSDLSISEQPTSPSRSSSVSIVDDGVLLFVEPFDDIKIQHGGQQVHVPNSSHHDEFSVCSTAKVFDGVFCWTLSVVKGGASGGVQIRGKDDDPKLHKRDRSTNTGEVRGTRSHVSPSCSSKGRFFFMDDLRPC